MTLLLAAGAAFLCGSRTFATLALTCWFVSLGLVDVGDAPLKWLGAPALAAILSLLAFGEIYADKQPQMKARTRPPPLIARMVSGALVGATVGASSDLALAGAALGTASAALGTLATFQVRRWLAERLGRDLPAAIVEDVVVVAASLAVLTAS
ncbi:DUF4126 family protein [Sphingomicrobium lutaoense]|uniref:Putative membrane protein n=1 Tax=Sphingomicrobium lutaoense TaxID=515949 RepID=A0A839YWG6_9SPHN|nr:DUF4126 family protein [Sphingomicrobium lutaoense]MBB3764551.1 putative membrane protein [Sphingomicrobium lutaoense]